MEIDVSYRIKELRKKLNLSQRAFADKISLKRNSISLIENLQRNPSNRTLNAICDAFNVNEEWLKMGRGEVFNKEMTFSLERYCEERNMSNMDLMVIKAYLDIPPTLREALLQHLNRYFKDREKTLYELEENYQKALHVASGTAPYNTTNDKEQD